MAVIIRGGPAKEQFWSALNEVIARFNTLREVHQRGFQSAASKGLGEYLSILAALESSVPELIRYEIRCLRKVFRQYLRVTSAPDADQEIDAIEDGFRYLLQRWVPEPYPIGLANINSPRKLVYTITPEHDEQERRFRMMADEFERRLGQLRRWESLLTDVPTSESNESPTPQSDQDGPSAELPTPAEPGAIEVSGSGPTSEEAKIGELTEVETSLPKPVMSPTPDEFVFVLSGNVYFIRAFGAEGSFGKLIGFDDLYLLLQSPGVPIPWATIDPDILGTVQGRNQPVLDGEALKNVQEELRRLQDEIDNTTNEAEQKDSQTKLDSLRASFKANTNTRGKSRSLQSAIDKARPKVLGRLKTAYEKLRSGKPSMSILADHFDHFVQAINLEGMLYDPSPAIPWKFNSED